VSGSGISWAVTYCVLIGRSHSKLGRFTVSQLIRLDEMRSVEMRLDGVKFAI